jgi:hypothetical protein
MERIFAYGKLIGLDAVTAPQNMNERLLARVQGAHVDFRGQINKHYASKPYASGATSGVISVEHYGPDSVVYAHRNGADIDLRSTTGVTKPSVYAGATYKLIDYTQFLDKLLVVSKDEVAQSWNGTAFADESAIPEGGCTTTIRNRLVVADIPSANTEVHVSKTDLINFTTGSAADDGAIINIRNQLTSKDRIVGLGNYEGDKLAIFCQNETLLYATDKDINNWQIVRDFRVPIGCIGRRTIKNVGTDLFFASPFGVHSIRRAANGVTLETVTFSRVVQDIYDSLVAGLPAGREPHAVWNPSLGHYILMFPKADDKWASMTFTYEPALGRGTHQSWNYDETNVWADASYFAGNLVFASPGFGLREENTLDPTAFATNFSVMTPVLWQGAPHKKKDYKRLMIRMSGPAELQIRVYDERGNLRQTTTIQPYPPGGSPSPANIEFPPIDLPCIHKMKGIQLEFLSFDDLELKIVDFALVVNL